MNQLNRSLLLNDAKKPKYKMPFLFLEDFVTTEVLLTSQLKLSSTTVCPAILWHQ